MAVHRSFLFVVSLSCANVGADAHGAPPVGSTRPVAWSCPIALDLPAVLLTTEPSRQGSRLVLVKEDGHKYGSVFPEEAGPRIDAMPAWSPGGFCLAFASTRENPSGSSLWILSLLKDAKPVRITTGKGRDQSPAWSPGDDALVFTSNRGGSFALWRVDLLDGGDGVPRAGRTTKLTHDEGDAVEPAWSRDGKWLAYTLRTGGVSILKIIPAQGGRAREITVGPSDRTPAWFPDSRHLVYSGNPGASFDADLMVLEVFDKNGRLRANAQPKRVSLGDTANGSELWPAVDVSGRFVFATSEMVVSADREASSTRSGPEPAPTASFHSLVFVDVKEKGRPLRVLYDVYPTSRLGIALAPVALDAKLLRKARLFTRDVRDAAIQSIVDEARRQRERMAPKKRAGPPAQTP